MQKVPPALVFPDFSRARALGATGVRYRLMIEQVKAALADIKSVYPDYDPDQESRPMPESAKPSLRP